MPSKLMDVHISHLSLTWQSSVAKEKVKIALELSEIDQFYPLFAFDAKKYPYLLNFGTFNEIIFFWWV